MESSRIVEQTKAVGVHVQGNNEIRQYFLIAVLLSDRTHVTVYRKWNQITNFQRDLKRALKGSKENGESLRYLKRTAGRVRGAAQSSTMGKLKMIDSLNQYLSTITHYRDVAETAIVQQFFKPNDFDLDEALWRTGRTYLYLSGDILSHSRMKSECIPSFNDSDHTTTCRPVSCGNDIQNSGNEFVDHAEQSANYVAVADFHENGQGMISIRRYEEVQVVERHESGWWLVRKIDGDCSRSETTCGYVPAAYLSIEPICDGEGSPITAGVINEETQASETESDCLGLSSSISSSDGSSDSGNHSPGSTDSYSETGRLDEAVENIAIRNKGEDYICKRTFKAESTEELSFQQGSILKVFKRNMDGWWLASYQGKIGLVPAVHLRKYSDPIRRMSLHMMAGI